MKTIFSVVTLLFLTTTLSGQNLVPNPGFEEFFVCPQAINTNKAITKVAPHWNSPSYGTPDLYNKCSKYKMGIQNVTGFTTPFSGGGFAGIIIFDARQSYREYLQVRLNEPLKENKIYNISFRYKLSSYSKYSADRISFSLGDTCVFYKSDSEISIIPAYSKVKDKAMDPYTGSWELLETEYAAKGGEKYLTIGNFDNNENTKTIHLSFINTQEPMLEHAAYYYIDEVSVSEKILPDTTLQDTTPLTLNKKNVNLSDSIILENVLFEYDSDKLLSGSFNELNEIIEILNNHPDWKIKIFGHTDNAGSIQYNLDLSERRASSAKKYLISNGISEERILSKGFGKSKPLVSRSDSESQKINRRVEIVFY